MSFLINALTAVFGKPKTFNDGDIIMFSPEERAQHTDMIEDTMNPVRKEEYHWRTKEDCASCDKHRVAMRIPQYHDFGHSDAEFICANCAKDMYDISRYLFNTIVHAHKSNYLSWGIGG